VKNRIVKTSIVSIAILASIVYFVRTFYSSSNTISYKIFTSNSDGFYLHKLLGIVPVSYQGRYSETVIDSFDNKEIVNVIDKIGSSHQNYIVLIENKSEVMFLKAYPFRLVGVRDKTVESKGWKKHVSLLIDLRVFNYYLLSKKITSKQEIINTYCFFISKSLDRTTHKILNSRADVDSLILEWPLIYKDNIFDTEHKLISASDIPFDGKGGVVYCWMVDKGIVKMFFEFNEDNTVDSEIIGMLGNETPGI
jgi:hypothetical protein